jgi:cyanophycinase
MEESVFFARSCSHPTSLALLMLLSFLSVAAQGQDNAPTVGPGKGWLIIDGGGGLTNEVIDRFVALAGGPDASFVGIPTAESDAEIDVRKIQQSRAQQFGIKYLTILHSRNRVLANSPDFVGPLRHASGVWIDGGRQWRLADAYLGTAVQSEIKALLDRGGVVLGGSAGASIQGSFLVRGAPGTPKNPDGDNTIMISPGHEVGFGLLPNSAIDQHIDARGREGDLHSVILKHPELLGIGIDQGAAIIVHGDSFFVVSGRVAITDGKKHDGAYYYFLSSGQAFNLRTRTPEVQDESPFGLRVTSATRSRTLSGSVITKGTGVLESRGGSESQHIDYVCGVSLYSVGNNVYGAFPDGPRQIKIRAREVNTNILHEYACKY